MVHYGHGISVSLVNLKKRSASVLICVVFEDIFLTDHESTPSPCFLLVYVWFLFVNCVKCSCYFVLLSDAV